MKLKRLPLQSTKNQNFTVTSANRWQVWGTVLQIAGVM